MEPAKSLIRTTVRSFFPQPRAILIVDALLVYSVLHLDDFAVLFSAQNKELRSVLNLLVAHRLVSKSTRVEARIGAARAIQREYYYLNYHDAVDAIKFRIVKLLEKVKDIYSEDQTKRKDWSCPRCKAEYDEYEILGRVSSDGFYCERCGEILEQNEAAVRERGDHAKIRQINDQLRPFQALIQKIDSLEVPENSFEEAFEKKREIPRSKEFLGAGKARYIGLDRPDKKDVVRRQEVVSADNIKVTIATETEREREDAEAKRKLAEQNARKNVLPEWIRKGIEPGGSSVKKEDGGVSPLPGLKAEEDEKKPSILEDSKMQDDLDAYMAEMERERLQKEREEADRGEEDDEDEDEDDFEDVVDTPVNSQQQNGKVKQELLSTTTRLNGIKREIDADGDSISGTDTGANTPMYNGPSSAPDPKRIKLANGDHTPAVKSENAEVGSDEDDDDEEFEDV